MEKVRSIEVTLLTGALLAFIIIISICFYVPLILSTWQDGDYALVACASGLEMCLVVLVIGGIRTRGWRG
jgi:hypothetical protein